MRDRFFDPPTSDEYEWPVNHTSEETFGKQRNVQHSGLTGGYGGGSVGVVRQQSDTSPMILSLAGFILHQDQHDEFIRWFNLCEDHSIHFRDFVGDNYEVIITEFLPIRKPGKNPRDPSIPLHYWSYTMKMEVLRFISGPWVGTRP